MSVGRPLASVPDGAVRVAERRRAPAPPTGLSGVLAARWRALWRSEPGRLWDAAVDYAAVERLFVGYGLLADLDDADNAASTYAKVAGEVRQLEDRLGLSPRSRLTLAAAIAAAAAGASGGPADLDGLVDEANA